MTTREGIVGITLQSAEEAARLFFDPIRNLHGIGPLFNKNGRGFSVLGRAVCGFGFVALLTGTIWAQLVTAREGIYPIRQLMRALVVQVHNPTIGISSVPSVSIVYPEENALVPNIVDVEGTVSGPLRNVYLVGSPEGEADYFVIGKAVVNKSGIWRASAYIGNSATQPGQIFRIRAILVPEGNEKPMREGEVLTRLPDTAVAISPAITIKRR